jgi:hypothetical protein
VCNGEVADLMKDLVKGQVSVVQFEASTTSAELLSKMYAANSTGLRL